MVDVIVSSSYGYRINAVKKAGKAESAEDIVDGTEGFLCHVENRHRDVQRLAQCARFPEDIDFRVGNDTSFLFADTGTEAHIRTESNRRRPEVEPKIAGAFASIRRKEVDEAEQTTSNEMVVATNDNYQIGMTEDVWERHTG